MFTDKDWRLFTTMTSRKDQTALNVRCGKLTDRQRFCGEMLFLPLCEGCQATGLPGSMTLMDSHGVTDWSPCRSPLHCSRCNKMATTWAAADQWLRKAIKQTRARRDPETSNPAAKSNTTTHTHTCSRTYAHIHLKHLLLLLAALNRRVIESHEVQSKLHLYFVLML